MVPKKQEPVAQDLSDATYLKIGNDNSIVYPLPSDIQVEYDFRLTMDDGIEISMNIYRPNTDKEVPVLMAFTDYSKDMWPEQYLTYTRGDIFRQLGLNLGDFTVSDEAPWEGPDPGFWVSNGYALIMVDARGSGKSTGKHDPFSSKVHKDFAKAIEWASAQPWTTGKVGITGTSYLGITQWYVAALRPKGLVAMNVWEGLTDFVRDAIFHGGIQETGFVPWWLGGVQIDPDAEPQFGMTDLPEIPSASSVTDYEVPPPANIENINVPALILSTWSNQGLHSRGGFEGYRRLTTEKYLYTHGLPEWTFTNSEEGRVYQKAFFDHYLKGRKLDRRKLMTVRLEVMKGDGEFYVREENNWPLDNTKYNKLYLNGYEGTFSEKELAINTVTQYTSTDVNDQVAFRHIFDKDTEIAGYAKLKLWVATTDGNDIDLFVAIRKIGEDGEAKRFVNALDTHSVIARGWLRVSMRKLDKNLASDFQPVLALDEYQPVRPHEIIPVEIEILPFAVLFEKGSTLELIMKGSDIPKEPTVQHTNLVNQGYHKIHAGKDHDSYLMLPITN